MCSPAPPIIYLSDSDEDISTPATTSVGVSNAHTGVVKGGSAANVAADVNVDSSSSSSSSSDDEPLIIDDKRNLWHIDYKDFLIANPIHGKFYRPKIWCSRCRKEGNHPVKLCHLPKYKICYICGGTGHLGQHCQNQHCKRCMDFHSTSNCNINIRDNKCRICNKYGHQNVNCPNHWRKFYNITDPRIDPDKIFRHQIQKNTNKSCSICGRHQHFSFECDKLRRRAVEISSPYDINTTSNSKFALTNSPSKHLQANLPRDYHEFLQRLNRTTPTSSTNTTTTPTINRKPFIIDRRPSLRYFDEANHLQDDQVINYQQPTTSMVTFSPSSSQLQSPLPTQPQFIDNNYHTNPTTITTNTTNTTSTNTTSTNTTSKNNNNKNKNHRNIKNSNKKKGPKNRSKKMQKEMKNKSKNGQTSNQKSNEDDFIKGGSIRNGRVKKSKPQKKRKMTKRRFDRELNVALDRMDRQMVSVKQPKVSKKRPKVSVKQEKVSVKQEKF